MDTKPRQVDLREYPFYDGAGEDVDGNKPSHWEAIGGKMRASFRSYAILTVHKL